MGRCVAAMCCVRVLRARARVAGGERAHALMALLELEFCLKLEVSGLNEPSLSSVNDGSFFLNDMCGQAAAGRTARLIANAKMV